MTEEQAPYFAAPADVIQYFQRKRPGKLLVLAEMLGVGRGHVDKIGRREIEPSPDQKKIIWDFLHDNEKDIF